ncbi:DUF5676 family membrane protein [Ralstonia pseudosolanacearum]|uniref:Uncharacterized protein n=1 Tax=Ralstonia solanacearum TaxID=305 RepID=A0AA92JQW5_RALSL|nr:DUF5676 family membrane protein [Ralstonia pseudosolanacearum]QOK91084.1 hypothetical protein HF908_06045 [Ralstonia pseudosolanacearum]QOK97365.1 hypothetical protein HF909_13610 [Ralstonia pseudosolanacearum]UWD92118.1 DUF5676 family membrane protein [Ralstonia pseudosolanacearum]CAH0444081.1 hypothetical protein LMG9673_04277 [Ralstonia pseudosolanacearum]
MKPVKTGVTFAITVMLFYALCAIVWFALPKPFMQFMTALFHGIDFGSLQSGKATIAGTVCADAILGIWAFFAATFFAWLNARFSPAS